MLVALLFLATILLLLAWRTLTLRRATRPTRRHRLMAPDDDPDFIRELHRRTRQVDDGQS